MNESDHSNALVLGEIRLTIGDLVEVARYYKPVALGESARRRIRLSHAVVETLLEKDVKVYGITTGFASLRDKRIDISQAGTLSENLIKTHACGVGEPYPEDVVRAAMFLRLKTFALGYSGVTTALVERLMEALNSRIYPFVPQQGSVGSSGDLAPLSHLFLALIGDPDGKVHKRVIDSKFTADRTLDRSDSGYISSAQMIDFVALRELKDKSHIKPLELAAKEGLAATNSAAFATALTALATYDGARLVESSELTTALSFEALQAAPDPLDEAVTASRPHNFHKESARAIRVALSGSDHFPDYIASGFNMAHYNQALLALTRLSNTNTDDSIKRLADAMRSAQNSLQTELNKTRTENGGADVLRARDRELTFAHKVFAPINTLWEETLWKKALYPDESESYIAPETRKQLSEIYHEHVSKIVRPEGDPDVQDNYSFRASPTILGAVRSTLERADEVVRDEFSSATDNPLILIKDLIESYRESANSDKDKLPEVESFVKWLNDNWSVAADKIVSAANFHGEPIGFAADSLAVAISEMGNISERRLAALTDCDHSKGLPSYLVWNPGLNSGMMLLQYVAASLASENKTLAVPSTTDSIPTGEGCEDHNSMATTAARKLAQIVVNVEYIIAIELLAAYQGVQFRKPAKLGSITTKVESLVAKSIEEPLLRLSKVKDFEEMKRSLVGLGLSEAAVDSIMPCMVDDVTLYPLVEIVTELVRKKKVSGLADGVNIVWPV